MTAPSPSLAGYWLYIRMSQWGFIFSFVSLFISPFSFQFEANQAASTSAQNCRVHLCTEIRGEPFINRGGLLPKGLQAGSQTVGPGSLLSPNPARTVCAGILRCSRGDFCNRYNNLRSHLWNDVNVIIAWVSCQFGNVAAFLYHLFLVQPLLLRSSTQFTDQ